MKTLVLPACLILAGTTWNALAQPGTVGPGEPMDKAHCEQMMQQHKGSMGKDHQGMMGKDHQGMMGKDHQGMMGRGMPRECMEMMGMQHGMAGDKVAQANAHKGTGVVKGVDASKGTVTLQHEPIPSLNWPAMTMPFTVPDKGQLAKLKPGQKVEFDFVQEGSKSTITRLK